ncbi:hypothetical protein GQ42DRAFT_148175 [Ramicandelaber brevisporus]|nr:hypothetical protein GQ42DRAFT_148175 [Ramicandelaber brevisporus]
MDLDEQRDAASKLLANTASEFLESLQGAGSSATTAAAASRHKVVTPGEVITGETSFMRGHGTHSRNEQMVASVAGTVERISQLISVRTVNARYHGEIGDVIVGRITDVTTTKRWKCDVGSIQEAALMLSSINLPGGVQRRKTELDELAMRSFFAEGDLIVAEVQTFFQDGTMSLHTRSLKYGKLRNGLLVTISPGLVKRSRAHFLVLPCGVDVILGVNGYVWVSKHVAGKKSAIGKGTETEIDPEEVYSNVNDPSITHDERKNIARVANCIHALSSSFVHVNDATIMYAYEESISRGLEPKHLLNPKHAAAVAAVARERLAGSA